MPKFTAILRNRNFFLLWLGQIISQVGDRLGFMALIGFAYSKKSQGSTSEIFKILLFTIIPVFLIGPIAGAYVDRWDRRRTMYVCDLLRMALVCIIPVFLFYAKNLAAAYLLIFIVFCLARFFLPAKLSIVPDLVDSGDLLIANSLVNITGMIAFIVGSGVSGVLIERVGVENGFYLDALSFLVSAALIFFIAKNHVSAVNLRKIGADIVEVIKKSVIQEIKEGTLYFISQKDIRITAGVLFVVSSALGVVSVVSIAFVQNMLHSATKDLGLLIMFLGLGLFAGSLLYGRFGSRLSQYKTIFSSLILTGIMIIIFSLEIERYPHFSMAALLSFCLGFVASPILIASNTIIHKSSDNEMRGKIFSSLEIVMHLGFLLFMYISSILAERFPQFMILVVIGCVFCILGILNLISHRKIPWLG
jgi:DHA3 family macrolide efflux protein-like MFS transporter